MTHHPIRVTEDGTRIYSNGTRYKPKSIEERKYAVRKPADPRAVWWAGAWVLPVEVLPEAARAMPETRPDELTLEHRATCRCSVCQRPQAASLWRRRARRRAATSASSVTRGR